MNYLPKRQQTFQSPESTDKSVLFKGCEAAGPECSVYCQNTVLYRSYGVINTRQTPDVYKRPTFLLEEHETQ